MKHAKTYTPLIIGSCQIDFPFILAPMAGFTHLPYREICMQLGAGLGYTELTVAEGIARQMPPTMMYLETSPAETPVAAHIYGNNPDSMARAAQVIQKMSRFCLIDINCGCPVRKVTSKGAGATLIRHPDKIYDIISAMKKATDLPITLKTRIGYTPKTGNVLDVIQAAESAGASAITIHARYASERHKGPADWEMLRQLKSETTIPLIGNGGAENAVSATQMMQQTGVDGVMIGRAALGNPWIFQELKCQYQNIPWTPPTTDEKLNLIIQHAKRTIEMMEQALATRRKSRYSPEQAGCRLFRAHLAKYFAGTPGIKQAMQQFPKIDTLEKIEQVTRDLLRR